MIKYFIIFSLACLPLCLAAQTQKNIVLTDFSFSFLGTGDVRATSIGINYHRFFSKRFGFNAAINKTSGRGGDIFFGPEVSQIQFDNLRIISNDNVIYTSIADYTIANIGASYRVNESTNQSLIVAAGINHKWIQSSRISGNSSIVENGREFIIANIEIQQERELAPYVAIDYVYYLFGDASLGIHLAVHAGGNIVSSAGLNVGFRF